MSNSIYFNARAKTLETKLLSKEQFVTIIDCDSFEDIKKILSKQDLIANSRAKNLSSLLCIVHEQEEEFVKFVKQSSPNEKYRDYFTLPFDYTNIQIAFLNSVLHEKPKQTLGTEGIYPIKYIEKNIAEKNYSAFSSIMCNCLEYVNSLEPNSPSYMYLVDTAFKKSKFMELVKLSMSNKHLAKITCFKIDELNIELALKLRNFEMFKSIMLTGGSLDLDFYKDLCEKSYEKITENTRFHTYRVFIDIAIESQSKHETLSMYDKVADSFPVSYFNEIRLNSGEDIPYLRYCFLKLGEIDNLQIVLSGLSTKVSKRIIKASLRRTYA